LDVVIRRPPGYWTRDRVIEAMQQWHAEYGHPPGGADWNVAQLRRRGQDDLVDRFYASGAAHLSTVINRFGGWSTMIEAAGLPTQPSGEHHQTDEHRATMARKLAPCLRAMRARVRAGCRQVRAAVLRAGLLSRLPHQGKLGSRAAR
jgi:Homing endonuclease associated repeat